MGGSRARPPKARSTSIPKFLKTTAGKLITLAFAVAVPVLAWVLTHPGGLLNKPSPSVEVVSLSTFPTAQVGQAPAAEVTVRNDGDGTASHCEILWSPLTSDPDDSNYPATIEFSLAGGESLQRDLRVSVRYTQPGTFEMAAKVVCDDTESSVAAETVTVR